ncbi:hypothetical protein EZS27_001413 [termite gut metagenome]|uniref:Uncharacterized protein n=1 Tax=termite gut metagenome TaxID=433724 RepID=A0A5J4SZ14_9ZZZZ
MQIYYISFKNSWKTKRKLAVAPLAVFMPIFGTTVFQGDRKSRPYTPLRCSSQCSTQMREVPISPSFGPSLVTFGATGPLYYHLPQ